MQIKYEKCFYRIKTEGSVNRQKFDRGNKDILLIKKKKWENDSIYSGKNVRLVCAFVGIR